MTPPPVQRLLVIRLGAMGDLIHVSPALRALKTALPHVEIHFLTSPAYQLLVERFDGVDRVWTFEKGASWKTAWGNFHRLAQSLETQNIETVISLQPNLRWALLAGILLKGGIRDRFKIYRKEKVSGSARFRREVARRHAVEDFYEPFRQRFGLDRLTRNDLIPQLDPGRLPDLPSPSFPQPVCLLPGVGKKRANRAWPADAYEELIRRLSAETHDIRFVLVGGPDEVTIANRLAGEISLENRCGRTDLLETAKRLVGCRLVIGADTGPLHLAAALGVPIVALYGPTSVNRTGPLGHQAIRILTPPDALDGWPCETPSCQTHSADAQACIRAIPIESVLAACRQILPVAHV